MNPFVSHSIRTKKSLKKVSSFLFISYSFISIIILIMIFLFVDAGLGEQPPADSDDKKPSSNDSKNRQKFMSNILSTSTSSLKTTPEKAPIPLPHLVYKLEFLEESVKWTGDKDDILDSIIQQSKMDFNENEKEKKREVKVIVVVELPIGGVVSSYNVGNSDDTLDVEIQKHSLMLNPKALLFSGIQAGIFDPNTDGPSTDRGGIRLNECAKALELYRKQEMKLKPNKKDGKAGINTMSLTFILPDFVDRKSMQYYSYCFQQTASNERQYAIAYFEMNTKKAKQETNESTSASSMIFSNQPSSGNDDDNNNGGRGGQQQPPQNPTNQQYQPSFPPNFSSSNSRSSHQGKENSRPTSHSTNFPIWNHSSSSSNNMDNDVTMEEQEDSGHDEYEEDEEPLIYSKSHLQSMLSESEAKVKKCKSKYSQKLKETLVKVNDQKEKFKKHESKRMEVIAAKDGVIQAQNAALKKRNEKLQQTEANFLAMQKRLDDALKARDSYLSLCQKPRMINTHSGFNSLIDAVASATPSKRIRSENKKEETRTDEDASSTGSSSYYEATVEEEQQPTNVSIDSSAAAASAVSNISSSKSDEDL